MHRFSEARLPTPWATFRMRVYRTGEAAGPGASALGGGLEEHVALVLGDVAGANVLCRVHSSCFTGEVLHSLRCDCKAQLDAALTQIAHEGRGVLVYLVQEGRGIGLGNKLAAYALQDEGVDTVDANTALGFAADARSYTVAADILRDCAVTSVRLITNNPAKAEGLRAAGLDVVAMVPAWTDARNESERYLATKRQKMGHR